MKVTINHKNGKQEIFDDVEDFLNYPEKFVIKKKNNTSMKKFVFIDKLQIRSIKIFNL